MKLAILLAFLLNNAFTPPPPIMAWNLVHNRDGIKISYDIYSCHGAPMLFWKMENSSGQNKFIRVKGTIVEGNYSQAIAFSVELTTNGLEGNCNQAIMPSSPCISLIHTFVNPQISLTVN
ncbi:MAG: hypothetical protein HOP11_15240 [Saprospiraceae bacterium]|nr:hypothetical protein [Saprospiraceae bacterium]